jgi:hypothetical protein
MRTALRFSRLLLRVYGFAALMAFCAIIPGCNFLYSGHGGPAWFVLPFVFPWVIFQLSRMYRSASTDLRPGVVRFAVISLLAYLPLSFVAAYAGAASIGNTFALPVQPLYFWGFFILPFGLAFCGAFFGL